MGQKLTAVAVITLVVFINCASVKLWTRFLMLFSFGKILRLAIIIVGGIAMLFQGRFAFFSIQIFYRQKFVATLMISSQSRSNYTFNSEPYLTTQRKIRRVPFLFCNCFVYVANQSVQTVLVRSVCMFSCYCTELN